MECMGRSCFGMDQVLQNVNAKGIWVTFLEEFRWSLPRWYGVSLKEDRKFDRSSPAPSWESVDGLVLSEAPFKGLPSIPLWNCPCLCVQSRGGRHTGQHKSCGSPFAPGVSLSKAHPLTNLRAQAPSTVPWAARHFYSALWLLFRLRRGRPNPEVASSGSAAVQQRPRIVDHFVGRKRPPREALELPCFPSC